MGVAGMPVKNSSLDITRISVLKKVSPDRQHGSARWTRACQLAAAQSPHGEIVTTQTARGQLMFFNPPRGRASDLPVRAITSQPVDLFFGNRTSDSESSWKTVPKTFFFNKKALKV
jgi:hypothetical protein